MKPMNDQTVIKADQEATDAVKRMVTDAVKRMVEKYNPAFRQERRKIMKPMMGMIVYYTNRFGETFPAIITQVYDGEYVDVFVFSNHGVFFECMVTHGEENSRYDYWEYMPSHQHMITQPGGEQE